MYSTVDDYLADKDPAAVDAFRKFRTLVLALGDDVEETVHTSEISWLGRPHRRESVRSSIPVRHPPRSGPGPLPARPPPDLA